MDVTQGAGDEQAKLWNGPTAHAWVDAQAVLDRMFEPFEELLLEAVTAGSSDSVLDVGCGTGGTTLGIARALRAKGRCTGIDISQPMIAAARMRAEQEGVPATFICANAQDHPFEPSRVDHIVSRFGVMFFDDPVRAFANLRRATRGGGRLRVIAWRSAADNPFMTTAERAAAPLLPTLPPRHPDAPGQFSLASDERVRAILEESGWTAIEIRPVDVECALPESELNRYVTRLGPVGRALQEADDRTRARVLETLRPAFDPFVRGSEVRFTAACWMVDAGSR